MRPVTRFQVLDRRQVIGGLTAAAGVAACDGAEDAPLVPSSVDPIAPVTSNDEFYVTSCCGTPAVDGAAWSLTVRTATATLATIDLAGLMALGGRDREHTLECIGANPYNQAISNAVWTGLPLAEVFAALGVEVPATTLELVMYCADGYSTSLPIGDLDEPIWLVWLMNGEPLPPEHGFPARMLVPGRYGMKNPKWILELELSDLHHTGFWEEYGWSYEAVYRPNTLVRHPDRTVSVVAGPVVVQGTAFAGRDAVVRVEVSVDGGPWVEAALDYAPGADIWALWRFDWSAEVGTHVLQARCVTASGAESGLDPDGTDPMSGYDGSMEVEVQVV